MGRSRKSKKAPEKPLAHRKLNIIGPKPVKVRQLEEELEESSESDFDLPLNPFDDQDNAGADDEGNVSGDKNMSTGEEDEHREETLTDTDEDLEDQEVQLPVKRKKNQKATKKKKIQRNRSDSDDHSDSPDEKEVPKISYVVSTFSLEELKKPVSRRKPKSRLIEISSDMEWTDTVDDSYDMTWCIPRIVPNPLSLHTVADYQQLVKKALKAKEPGAKILVDELPNIVPENDKENIPQPEAAAQEQALVPVQTKAAGKTKSKARKEADILPANVAMNEKIKQLRGRWECSMTTCLSEICFVPADGPHFALSHDHIEKWAAAILRGPEFATLNASPNIAAFDLVSTHSVVSKSPILQARLNNMAKEKGPQAPVFNVVLPNNFGMYQDFMHTSMPHPPPLASAPNISTNLLPANYTEGSKIDLHTFCEVYALAKSIKQRLQANAITGTHAFAHMSGTDLQAMGFKIGEVIDLKEAIKEWAQALH